MILRGVREELSVQGLTLEQLHELCVLHVLEAEFNNGKLTRLERI